MPNYVRRYVPGASVFVTIVTDGRRPLFAEESNVDRLRAVMAAERAMHPFDIDAAVVLPDHLHLLLTLPPDDADYSSRIGRVKAAFTKSLLVEVSSSDRTSANPSRDERRERDVWQRRFLEYTIRNVEDFGRHTEYIHFNPVKHGHCCCPHDWKHSSFGRWVERGLYKRDWLCACNGPLAVAPPKRLP